MARARGIVRFDWITIFIFIALVCIGWINIYSASLEGTETTLFDLSQVYSRQLMFMCLSVLLIIFILAVDSKFYERFSSVIYIISLLSLLALYPFGNTVSGATSWFAFGGFSIQPSEFAKAATALALAKYVSDLQTNLEEFKHQLYAFVIIMLPAIFIIPQPDPGSALVYIALFFPLYREGLHFAYLLLGFFMAALFVATLAFGIIWVSIGVLLILLVFYFKKKKKKRKQKLFKYSIIAIVSIGFAFSVNYIFENVFEQRHRDRFNIVLGKEVDVKGIGYNTNQSEIAIGNGGWLGKGWTQGTQTKGNFVPEQHTDYIFSTVGEEWGFLGSMAVIILFIALIVRILILAEKQKSQFSRVYGYCVASIIFIHFLVNIGMVIGLLPTVGIPLPFFSYGGSGLWGFTILLFIFIKLDSTNYINS